MTNPRSGADDATAVNDGTRVSTGVSGLDAVLGGGLPRNRPYLVQGNPGTGKTTISLQFSVAGSSRGERVLYVTYAESESEVRALAESHGWSLDDIIVKYQDPKLFAGDFDEQSVFHPVDLELPQTMEALFAAIEEHQPQRLVIDALSEIRLLASDQRWFRRQILALKDYLATRDCTTLLCDDWVAPERPVESVVHGIIELEQVAVNYGPDRRRLRVKKLRGTPFASGYHDIKIRTGGVEVYPRLVAAEFRRDYRTSMLSSGIPKLDAMLGGGIDQAATTLLLGPSGCGKSVLASKIAVSLAETGVKTLYCEFDERTQVLCARSKHLGIDLDGQVANGTIDVRQIDPAELTPGEFSHTVKTAVDERDVRLLVLDSLTGYAHAMPDERSLALHLFELLGFLCEREVTVLMAMTQHGLVGTSRRMPFDISYISDTVLLLQLVEAGGLLKTITVYKRRLSAHDATTRVLEIGREGILIGEPIGGVGGGRCQGRSASAQDG